MNSRKKILNRLRQSKFVESKSSLPEFNDSDIFADYPSAGSLLDIFAKNFESLSGELIIVADINEAGQLIYNIVSESDNKKCLTHSSPLIDQLFAENKNLSNYFERLNSKAINSKVFSGYEIGLTTADFLVARTGSIVLRSISAGGRRLSVLPPTHIVLAEKKQLVYSLDQVFKNKLINSNSGSFATIISGPSRTSDIEKQLVLGAHGPRRLITILI